MKVFDLNGNVMEELDLPKIFSAEPNKEVIKKVFLAAQSSSRQRYGANELAGLRSSAHYHGSRHYRYSMMNKEMSRIPRIHGVVGYLSMTARVAPHAVKGRRAHPPKPEKIWLKKINKKEYNVALKHAIILAKTKLIFTDDLENIEKTKQVKSIFEKHVKEELKRSEKKKIRAGVGKRRGRRYRKRKGPLVVVSGDCKLMKSAKNIPGVDIVNAKNMDIRTVAPGGTARRVVIMTKSGMNEISKILG